jgi:hypothetical protein
MKSLLVVALALVFLIPLARKVFAAPAGDVVSGNTTRLPFKGTLQSNETYSTVFPTMYVTANGSGEASQLGPFTVSYHVEQNQWRQPPGERGRTGDRGSDTRHV